MLKTSHFQEFSSVYCCYCGSLTLCSFLFSVAFKKSLVMHSLSLPCINMGFNGDRNSTAEVILLLRKSVMQSVHFILTQNTNSAAVSSGVFLYAPFTAHAIRLQSGFEVRNRERLQWRKKMSQHMEVNRIISLFYRKGWVQKHDRKHCWLVASVCILLFDC